MPSYLIFQVLQFPSQIYQDFKIWKWSSGFKSTTLFILTFFGSMNIVKPKFQNVLRQQLKYFI